jgi:hypothetical protein
LSIQFLFTIQALGILRAERSDLRGECSYGSGHWVIWDRTQHDVVAAIFGKDGSRAPSLAHLRRDGDLTSAGYCKTLSHGHETLP